VTTAPFRRADALARLESDSFDLVVIGGGVTGAGVALDAASRGLRTALVERGDFASGTSSKSSKLVHGGLRYLQQGEVGLVYEALAERQRLLRNAPHLVKLLPFLIPMFGRNGVIPAKIARLLGTAMWGYDLTGGFRIGKFHKRVTKAEALEYFPTLPPENLVSGYLYYDAAADDARLVLTLLRTAAYSYDAVVANQVSVVGLGHNASGRADRVEVEADGRRFEIRTRAVVNAAGVWSDEVRALDEGQHPDTIRPAKGVHISVPHRLLGNTIAAVIPVRKDRRSVFVVPQGDFSYIGTTDTDYDGPLDDPECTPQDVEYLLDAINAACVNTIRTEDIVGTWAGLRPLVKSASSGRTADLSRRHKVGRSRSGVVTITGGKLTTYRRMAADTVDAVVGDMGDVPGEWRKSRTKKLPLRGAEGYATAVSAARGYPAVSPQLAEHLADRYGGEARALMGMVQTDPELAEPLVPGLPYVRAEALFAVRHEMARSVDDVLSRRTRARLYARDDTAEAAGEVAALIAGELDWSAEQADASAARYRELCEHERRAADLPPVELADALAGGPTQ
jgi:glycerol-3-phosphate dehydrogenase